jgi:hypothetical protein
VHEGRAPAIVEVCAVDRPCNVAVAVTEQVAGLLRVVAVHRGRVPQRVEVRQRRQFLAREIAQHVPGVVVDHQVAVLPSSLVARTVTRMG